MKILSWSLDAAGPMARSVRDVAILLDAAAGYDPLDPTSAEPAPRDRVAANRGHRSAVCVGVPRRLVDTSELDHDVNTAFEDALARLACLGMVVRDIDIEDLDLLDPTFNPIMLSEAAAFHHRQLVDGADYGTGFRRRVADGFGYTAVDYIQAQRGRTRIARNVANAMRDVDVIATPVSDRTAATFAEYAVGHGSPFTRVFNLTGQPSLSLPCGFDAHNLPIGLLLSGRPFDEATVLAVALRYEQSTDWHRRRPPLDVGPQDA